MRQEHLPTVFSILVVDDEASIRSLLVEDLRNLGFNNQIFEAEHGIDGIKIFQKNKEGQGAIALIISDINMPAMNGIDFLKEIRKESTEVPVLMLTTEGDRDSIIKAAQEKANNYLVKPWNRQVLGSKIISCLSKGKILSHS